MKNHTLKKIAKYIFMFVISLFLICLYTVLRYGSLKNLDYDSLLTATNMFLVAVIVQERRKNKKEK